MNLFASFTSRIFPFVRRRFRSAYRTDFIILKIGSKKVRHINRMLPCNRNNSSRFIEEFQ